MDKLLATLRGLDTNQDGTISAPELAADAVKRFIDYSKRTSRDPDSLKDLRDNLELALDPRAKPEQKANARDYIENVLSTMGAHNPQNLRDALVKAATLVTPPRDLQAEQRASDKISIVQGAAESERRLISTIPAETRAANPGLERQIQEGYKKAAEIALDARPSIAQQQYEATKKIMVEKGTFSDAVDEALRKSLGVPPTKAEADKAQALQQELVELGKQLAQYKPKNVEAAPSMQQLSDVVAKSPPTTGRSGR